MADTKMVHINAFIYGEDERSEAECMEFCQKIDVDGELARKVRQTIMNHVAETAPEMYGKLAFFVD